LEERGIGLMIGSVAVPIVAGAVIFDLLAGDPMARPGPEAGYAACEAATTSPAPGAVGAGTGASVAKAGGNEPRPGRGGLASREAGGAVVAAVMVANGVGGIWDDDRHEWVAPLTAWDYSSPMIPGGNTTIGAVVTDARLTKEQVIRVAVVAHDGIARAVRPAHTLYDGDTMFCLATGTVPAPPDAVEAVAAHVVPRPIPPRVRRGPRPPPRRRGGPPPGAPPPPPPGGRAPPPLPRRGYRPPPGSAVAGGAVPAVGGLAARTGGPGRVGQRYLPAGQRPRGAAAA